MHAQIQSENLKGRDDLIDLGTDRTKNWDRSSRNTVGICGLDSCLQMGSTGQQVWIQPTTFGLHKKRRNTWLSAFQDGQCSTKL